MNIRTAYPLLIALMLFVTVSLTQPVPSVHAQEGHRLMLKLKKVEVLRNNCISGSLDPDNWDKACDIVLTIVAPSLEGMAMYPTSGTYARNTGEMIDLNKSLGVFQDVLPGTDRAYFLIIAMDKDQSDAEFSKSISSFVEFAADQLLSWLFDKINITKGVLGLLVNIAKQLGLDVAVSYVTANDTLAEVPINLDMQMCGSDFQRCMGENKVYTNGTLRITYDLAVTATHTAPATPNAAVPQNGMQKPSVADCTISVYMRVEGNTIISDHKVECKSPHRLYLGVANDKDEAAGHFVNGSRTCENATICTVTLTTQYHPGRWKASTTANIDQDADELHYVRDI